MVKYVLFTISIFIISCATFSEYTDYYLFDSTQRGGEFHLIAKSNVTIKGSVGGDSVEDSDLSLFIVKSVNESYECLSEKITPSYNYFGEYYSSISFIGENEFIIFLFDPDYIKENIEFIQIINGIKSKHKIFSIKDFDIKNYVRTIQARHDDDGYLLIGVKEKGSLDKFFELDLNSLDISKSSEKKFEFEPEVCIPLQDECEDYSTSYHKINDRGVQCF